MDSTMEPHNLPSTQLLTTVPNDGHHRNGSSDSTNSNPSAYHFILEHILSYPGTYEPRPSVKSNELPLRSMYSLNSTAPPLSGTSSAPPPMFTHSTCNSPVIPSVSSMSPKQVAMRDNRVAAAVFKSSIMDQIAKLPQQPASLPPAFVTNFLERIFPYQLECVDFPQSLTALDYLRDLEMRRRKEVAYALHRHGIERSVLELPQSLESLQEWPTTIATWIRTLMAKEKKADKLYTQLYVALRRWILINEMALQPFNKTNCHAMLNTLYPPVPTTQPSTKLTIPCLMIQREGFFNYVKAVESQGPRCLQTLMKQGARPGEVNGWPAVKRTLNNYLSLANRMIRESQRVSSTEVVINCTPSVPPNTLSDCSPIPEEEEEEEESSEFDNTPAPSKTNSGISFNTSDVPPLSSGSTETIVDITQYAKSHVKKPSTSSVLTAINTVTPPCSATTTANTSPVISPTVPNSPDFSPSAVSTAPSSRSPSSRSPSSHFDFGKGSTLERLARELRKIKPRRVKVDEIIKQAPLTISAKHSMPALSPTSPTTPNSTFASPTTPTFPIPGLDKEKDKEKHKSVYTIFSLRKMKSLGELRDRNGSSSSLMIKRERSPPRLYVGSRPQICL